uniref:Uncharacterized protein n=1 Tax=Meloidogyne incognita TaxID=6306 RepID=A0A914KQ30_MELIC
MHQVYLSNKVSGLFSKLKQVPPTISVILLKRAHGSSSSSLDLSTTEGEPLLGGLSGIFAAVGAGGRLGGGILGRAGVFEATLEAKELRHAAQFHFLVLPKRKDHASLSFESILKGQTLQQ